MDMGTATATSTLTNTAKNTAVDLFIIIIWIAVARFIQVSDPPHLDKLEVIAVHRPIIN